MKPTEFKKLIKEAVKEAIQEELKDILLEAVIQDDLKAILSDAARSNVPTNIENPNTISESKDVYAQPELSNPRQLTAQERRDMFSGILGEIKKGGTISTAYAGDFNPRSKGPEGGLPEGSVGLDQIMAMMKK